MMNPYFTQMLRGRLGIGPNQSAAQMGTPMQMGGLPGYPPFGQMMPPQPQGNTGVVPPHMLPYNPGAYGHMFGGAQYGSALGQEGGPHAPADPTKPPAEGGGQHPMDPVNPKFPGGQMGPMRQFKNWWEF